MNVQWFVSGEHSQFCIPSPELSLNRQSLTTQSQPSFNMPTALPLKVQPVTAPVLQQFPLVIPVPLSENVQLFTSTVLWLFDMPTELPLNVQLVTVTTSLK